MGIISFLQKVIRYSFYALFLFVPLVFVGDTSELFEFNKMWLTYGLATIIAVSWISNMIIEKQFKITRTKLDVPILLFILSQCISTIFSLDQHISWWGYYSRFNGGLLSLLTYVFLYYAFVSNMEKIHVKRVIQVSLFSGLLVALWGLPSHFGYDPTCFAFRGSFDVSCWTAAFQPKARIFSTLGQPDWLAAYLTILLPIALVKGIAKLQQKKLFSSIYYFFLSALFYLDFLYTRSKGSFLALSIALLVFFAVYLVFTQENKEKIKIAVGTIIGLILITMYAGAPFSQLDKFTFSYITSQLHKPVASTQSQTPPTATASATANAITGELGGTDSGKIRLYVWEGAMTAWLHNPFFGTGVETFAFAYYLYRPAAHNLTSEWDYLYNKAHNEYLNYLATTGAFGLLSYLAIIFLFLFHNGKYWISLFKKRKSLVLQKEDLVLLGIILGYITIIISNFFGFSVVIINEYFFIIPALFYMLTDGLKYTIVFPVKNEKQTHSIIKPGQWIGICVVWILGIYWILVLINYWVADKSYALGLNYDHAGMYQNAYQPLHAAVSARSDEPIFQDELAVNDAILAQALFTNKDATNGAKLADEAVMVSNALVSNYPRDVIFWKSRVRVFYTLAQIDPKYLSIALDAIIQAQKLAPTDAKVSYNLGLLYAQSNQFDNAITTLKHTIELKKDYREAYYALALLLHQQAVDKNGTVVDQAKLNEAVKDMLFIYQVLAPGDTQAKEALKTWGKLPNGNISP